MTTSSSITTLELPRNLRFTVGDRPRVVLEREPAAAPLADRLSQIVERQRVGLLRDGALAFAVIALALLISLGLAAS